MKKQLYHAANAILAIGIAIGSYYVGKEIGVRQVNQNSGTTTPAGIITSLDKLVCSSRVFPEEINALAEVNKGVLAGYFSDEFHMYLHDDYLKCRYAGCFENCYNIEEDFRIALFETFNTNEQKETIDTFRRQL